jgi:NADPH-dependent glutamate synthase beta subunit-like oxidoreductase
MMHRSERHDLPKRPCITADPHFSNPKRPALPRGNVRANTADYQTSRPNVFSADDMLRGQSLVVWAIREGRLCARAIDQFLMGTTNLPR